MPEIANLQDARDRLARLYQLPPSLPDNLLDDYAQIAWFLCDGGRFQGALEEVSRNLWKLYINLGRDTRNRFTTAISLLGSQYGFMYDESKHCSTNVVVLVGAVDGASYLNWVKGGLFFKDDMDAKHGEHSHTLQWLAVAVAGKRFGLGIRQSASYLYRHIYEVKPTPAHSVIVPGFKLKPKGKDQAPRKDVSLWSWLVDCFPVSGAQGQGLPADESLFSESFRCPQYLMRYLFDSAGDDHFVATYLRYRYLRRRWLDQYASGYDSISGGATSKNYISHKLAADARLPQKRLTAIKGPDEQVSAFVRDLKDGKVIAKVSQNDADHAQRQGRKYHAVTMHGIQGELRDFTQYA